MQKIPEGRQKLRLTQTVTQLRRFNAEADGFRSAFESTFGKDASARKGSVRVCLSQGLRVCNYAVAGKPRPERAAATPACMTMGYEFLLAETAGRCFKRPAAVPFGSLGLLQF